MDERVATLICAAPKVAEEPGPDRTRYLVVLRGGIPGAVLPLGPGPQILGRSADNPLVLDRPTVSRRHARFDPRPDEGVWLTDLGSSNGTFLNGRRLPAGQPAPIRDGDRIGFGPDAAVRFALTDPAEESHRREMFERTVRDPLTGLFHRAYFLDQVGPLARRSAEGGLGLAIVLLDVDHFKAVNDSLGHDAGDAVLREVAATLRQSTRADDLVARYGGEEFVAALPVAAPDLATERAERIRRDLAGRRIAAAGRPLRVTASLGLAFSPAGRPRPPAALISDADHGLYQAKRAGRNRVVFRPEPATVAEGSRTTIDYPIPT